MDAFWSQNGKTAPKVSINDKVYRVFWTTFLLAPKRCFTNGFLMFCNAIKQHEVLVKNLMLFDTFWSQNAEMAPKSSINDKVYKVFWITFSETPNVVYLMFFVVLLCRQRVSNYSENLMLLEDFWGQNAKRAPKVSMNNRFYKVFWTPILQPSKRCFTNGFLMFCYVMKWCQVLVKT